MQNTWRAFNSLIEARSALRGRTRAALELVVEQLFKDEEVAFVASGEVNPGISWDDGVVVLTSRRLHAASCSEYGFTLAHFVELSHAVEFRELQGGTGIRTRFKVNGLDAVQGITLLSSTLEELQQKVDTTLDTNRVGASSPERPSTPGTPSELLRQLGALHEAGILTHEEFDTKKAEILRRI